jgi:hypothetical protein
MEKSGEVRKVYVSICTIQNISPLRDLRFQGKSNHVHTFRSLLQQLEKIHLYIREIFNCLHFRILTLFKFF